MKYITTFLILFLCLKENFKKLKKTEIPIIVTIKIIIYPKIDVNVFFILNTLTYLYIFIYESYGKCVFKYNNKKIKTRNFVSKKKKLSLFEKISY